MENKFNKPCAKRQGFGTFIYLTLKQYVKLEELPLTIGTTRSALIRELIQADIATRKNNGKTAQPPP